VGKRERYLGTAEQKIIIRYRGIGTLGHLRKKTENSRLKSKGRQRKLLSAFSDKYHSSNCL